MSLPNNPSELIHVLLLASMFAIAAGGFGSMFLEWRNGRRDGD